MKLLRSILCILMLTLSVALLSGCDKESSDIENSQTSKGLKYTWWQNTSGTILEFTDNSCSLKYTTGVGNDSKCKLDEDVYGTGISKVMICNFRGDNCHFSEVKYQEYSDGDSIIIKTGGTGSSTYYYKGTIEH